MGSPDHISNRNSGTIRDRNDRIICTIIILGLVTLTCWWSPPFWEVTRKYLVVPSPFQDTRNPAYLIKAYRGAVASENELCSKMGVDTLRQGGNAVDAAISTILCAGVVNMFSSGIGGGGFMTVRIPPKLLGESSEVWTINFRETAPALSNNTMYKDHPSASRTGGLAVGVPGELRGLEEAHRRWGSIPWKRLVEPNAKLAAGWRVQRELARRIQMSSSLMLNNADWRATFAPRGILLNEGDQICRANLSRTLSVIAEQGADAFYKGPIADALIEKVGQAGGILSHKDLDNYRTHVEKTLEGSYHGRKIYAPPAPAAGPLLLQMLNVLENYHLGERTALNVHRMVEILKFAFASRTRMCDPVSDDDLERIERIMTKKYASEIYSNITDDTTHSPEYYNPEYDILPDHGTTHTSIVDRNGMAVSITSTVGGLFGSKVLDPITGVILNNEMDDFSIPGTPNEYGLWPSPYNYPEPGKRPLSSTVPSIIENPDGSFYAAIGGSGGSRIYGSVLQVLLNLDWGLDASEAVEFGRLHYQPYPLTLDVDDIYPSEILDSLRQLGHNITISDIDRVAAVVQVVVQKGDIIYAASDSRKNGIAAGY